MKKGELKKDLLLLKKLSNEEFKLYISKAYDAFKILNIKGIEEYYSYQLYFDEFKGISYDEIISYDRLLNLKYAKSIELLNNQIKEKSKILTFPNIN